MRRRSNCSIAGLDLRNFAASIRPNPRRQLANVPFLMKDVVLFAASVYARHKDVTLERRQPCLGRNGLKPLSLAVDHAFRFRGA